jgi:hypothetical protein
MIITNDIPFNSPELQTIPVSQFYQDYQLIRDGNGQILSSRCADQMTGELINFSHLFKSFCDLKLYQTSVAGCCQNRSIPLPNPWRLKANGRIIRHMPISLYSDDTSGNQSKKWNKHISYFFTLSGLPPSHTNQAYNCHFLATSNSAGPMELACPIVDELKSARYITTEIL